ncbi:hypothetical protein ISS05_00960 [Candidatus Woesearchaeota archaeon]|nr:hypothetical protein [Candidatus Woesearchaeota archaeon]
MAFEILGLELDIIGITVFIAVSGAVIYFARQLKHKKPDADSKERKSAVKKISAAEKAAIKQQKKQIKIEKELVKEEVKILEVESELGKATKDMINIGEVSKKEEEELDNRIKSIINTIRVQLSKLKYQQSFNVVEKKYLIGLVRLLLNQLMHRIKKQKEDEGATRNISKIIDFVIRSVEHISKEMYSQEVKVFDVESDLETLKFYETEKLQELSPENSAILKKINSRLEYMKFKIKSNIAALKFITTTLKDKERIVSEDFNNLKEFDKKFHAALDRAFNNIEKFSISLREKPMTTEETINGAALAIRYAYNEMIQLTDSSIKKNVLLMEFIPHTVPLQKQILFILDKGLEIEKTHIYLVKLFEALNETVRRISLTGKNEIINLFMDIQREKIKEFKIKEIQEEKDKITLKIKEKIQTSIVNIERISNLNRAYLPKLNEKKAGLIYEGKRIINFLSKINKEFRAREKR